MRIDIEALTTEVMARYMVNRQQAKALVLEAAPPAEVSYSDAVDGVCQYIDYFKLAPGSSPQPLPTPTGVEAEVCADIAARQRVGIAKYGRTLAESQDDMIQHAYLEALDLANYLKAEIIRRRGGAK